MLRLFIPFATGIYLEPYLMPGELLLFCSFAFCLTLIASYGILPVTWRFALKPAIGSLMILLSLSAGMLTMELRSVPKNKSLFSGWQTENHRLLVRIAEQPVSRLNTWKANGELREYRLPDTSFRISGGIQLIFKKDSTLGRLAAGQILLINKAPDTIADNSNPGGFNFKRYSDRQGIMHQIFLTQKDFRVIGIETSAFERFLNVITDYILLLFKTHIKGSEEAGLAEALLIGYKNDLDKGLVQSYSNTGVVHVIAISGLHLALIYWILAKGCDLLKLPQRSVRPIVVLSGLWIFALLAGASPSVVRSAVMFTVIVGGELLHRKAHIINCLAASAFLLLCYQPYWLWDLGFQLSYLAVLSLVIFAKPINNALYFSNPGISGLWNLVSVTIAAQILTTPFTLLNFHKFPLLFLFTNCICVPLSSLLLMGELLLCCVGWSPQLAGWLGWLLFYGLRWMNDVVRFFERYPFSNFYPIQISNLQAILLYLGIALFTCWLIYRKSIWLFSFLAAVCTFLAIRAASFKQAESQRAVVIYNIPGKSVVDIFEGRNAESIEYSTPPVTKDDLRKQVQNNRVMNRVIEQKVIRRMISGSQVAVLGGLRIGWILSSSDRPLNDSAFDIIILSHNSLLKSIRPIAGLKLRLVVADATNSKASLAKYRQLFHRLNIPYHSVSEQGAFVRNLN